jgi:dTDP-4-dehydrorhamnose 3,5-epimerase
MKFHKTAFEGCYTIEPDIHEDERGWFTRVFCAREVKSYFGDLNLVQTNHSFNSKKGTFRGLHYQEAPFADAKLVRCIAGSVIDIVVDLRPDSLTFMRHLTAELSARNRTLIFLPKGMAHGFQTLEDNTELIYQHSEFYVSSADKGLRYDDPKLSLTLPCEISAISEKDKNYPLLKNDFKGIAV